MRTPKTFIITTILVIIIVLLMSISAFNQPLASQNHQYPLLLSAHINAETALSGNSSLYAEKCSACHNLPKPEEKGFSKSEWQRIVNRMMVKYGASETITGKEAGEIVAYLGTFAPKNNNPSANNLYATDIDDVWSGSPVQAQVHNFVMADSLKRLSRYSTRVSDNKAKYKIIDGTTPDASMYQVEQIGAENGQYAVTVDPEYSSNSIDTTVRFQIPLHAADKSVGFAIGWRGNNNFAFVKYDLKNDRISIVHVDGASHTILPTESINKLALSKITDISGWHTLRVMVKGIRVKAWIDAVKRLNADYPQYEGGKVGLVTDGSTNAYFSHWTIDYYK